MKQGYKRDRDQAENIKKKTEFLFSAKKSEIHKDGTQIGAVQALPYPSSYISIIMTKSSLI